MNYVAFSGLGLQFYINPIAIQFLGLKIHWYGIIISIGFLTAFIIIMRLCKKQNIDEDTMLNLILITTPIAVIGARFYYVVFNFAEYKYDLTEILKIWHGGLGIYGAIIASIITIFIYTRIKKINVLPVADIGVIGFVIAQSIGRWGNFVNAEAYGTPTSLPWAMTLIENGIYKSVHPTFLYESIWSLIIFCILIYSYKYFRKKDGNIFFLYMILYGFGRFFIENLRADSLYLGPFRVSQLVSILFVSFGTVYFIKRLKNINKQI